MSITEQERQDILDQVYRAEISISAKRALEAVVGAISTEVNIVSEDVEVINQTIVNQTAGVSTVNGLDGDVVLDSSSIGLGNVDNTSDADKPVSTAQQAAIDAAGGGGGAPVSQYITDDFYFFQASSSTTNSPVLQTVVNEAGTYVISAYVHGELSEGTVSLNMVATDGTGAELRYNGIFASTTLTTSNFTQVVVGNETSRVNLDAGSLVNIRISFNAEGPGSFFNASNNHPGTPGNMPVPIAYLTLTKVD